MVLKYLETDVTAKECLENADENLKALQIPPREIMLILTCLLQALINHPSDFPLMTVCMCIQRRQKRQKARHTKSKKKKKMK